MGAGRGGLAAVAVGHVARKSKDAQWVEREGAQTLLFRLIFEMG